VCNPVMAVLERRKLPCAGPSVPGSSSRTSSCCCSGRVHAAIQSDSRASGAAAGHRRRRPAPRPHRCAGRQQADRRRRRCNIFRTRRGTRLCAAATRPAHGAWAAGAALLAQLQVCGVRRAGHASAEQGAWKAMQPSPPRRPHPLAEGAASPCAHPAPRRGMQTMPTHPGPLHQCCVCSRRAAGADTCQPHGAACCRHLGCRSPECELCTNNPKKMCEEDMAFKDKYAGG